MSQRPGRSHRVLTAIIFWSLYPAIHLVEMWDDWVARLNDAEDG